MGSTCANFRALKYRSYIYLKTSTKSCAWYQKDTIRSDNYTGPGLFRPICLEYTEQTGMGYQPRCLISPRIFHLFGEIDSNNILSTKGSELLALMLISAVYCVWVYRFYRAVRLTPLSSVTLTYVPYPLDVYSVPPCVSRRVCSIEPMVEEIQVEVSQLGNALQSPTSK